MGIVAEQVPAQQQTAYLQFADLALGEAGLRRRDVSGGSPCRGAGPPITATPCPGRYAGL